MTNSTEVSGLKGAPFKRTGARECDRSASGLADYLAVTRRPYGHVTDDQYLEEAIKYWSHLNEDQIELAIASAANIAEARAITLREQLKWRREMLDEMCRQMSSRQAAPGGVRKSFSTGMIFGGQKFGPEETEALETICRERKVSMTEAVEIFRAKS
jgi:hypothetical protein